MKRWLILFMVLGLLAAPVATGAGATATTPALAKLVASDGMASDRFGISVAVSGDTAVVGAPWEEDQRGAAYVFTRVAGGWVEQAKLIASDGLATLKFGFAVALSGDTAVIGTSPYHSAVTQGSAYIFERVDTTWVQKAKVTASDGAAGDGFGSSVAVSGDHALIGAYTADVGSNKDQGQAYAFSRAGGEWREQARLIAPDGAGGDNFGQSVAVAGKTAIVGSPADDVGDNDGAGSAYVFTLVDRAWTLEEHLTPSKPADDAFGFSVGVSGDIAVAGAVGSEGSKGAAYVFSREDSIWTEQARLTALDGVGGDEFGRSAAVSGDTIVVGAQRDSTGTNAQQGSAYVFTRQAGLWTEQKKLVAADGGVSDLFGVSASISRGTVMVGAGFHDLHRGAAYVWEQPHTRRG